MLDPDNHYPRAKRQASAQAVATLIEHQRPTAAINLKTMTLTRSHTINNLGDLRHRLVQSVIELLENKQPSSINVCDASDCDWLFLTHSNPRRRRWCDSTTCGNQNRVKRFRAKNKADNSPNTGR
jgi:predicted RNA-binding Zn ribbon-like protein